MGYFPKNFLTNSPTLQALSECPTIQFNNDTTGISVWSHKLKGSVPKDLPYCTYIFAYIYEEFHGTDTQKWVKVILVRIPIFYKCSKKQFYLGYLKNISYVEDGSLSSFQMVLFISQTLFTYGLSFAFPTKWYLQIIMNVTR